MKPVSVVVPVHNARASLAASLPPLLAELELRALGDEVVLVDDGGEDGLEAWVAATFPPSATFDTARVDVRVFKRKRNAGFARAAQDGVRAAGHAHVLVLAPDVVVTPGFLAPLVDALDDPVVAAASPRIVDADGRGLPRLVWRNGMLETEAVELDVSNGEPCDAAYASCAALLARRDELLAAGLDARFAPGELADVDLCWAWKKSGRRVVAVPRSVVTRTSRNDSDLPRALEEMLATRNRLLLTWKHLDAAERRREHVEALEARVLEALLAGRREEVAAYVMALENGN